MLWSKISKAFAKYTNTVMVEIVSSKKTYILLPNLANASLLRLHF